MSVNSVAKSTCAAILPILASRVWVIPLVLFTGQPLLAAERVSFNRDIRPLLNSRCSACHGPDEDQREAGLRLDTEQGAKADLGGYAAVVAGEPAASELLRRVTSRDDDEAMPPAGSGQRLSGAEVELLRRWIAEGAHYDVHWAYVPPEKPPLPRVRDPHVPVNALDLFWLARLDEEQLNPAREADRRTLARRVALDLTGLPPTWAEVEAYVADDSETAHSDYVDRMLEQPAFGEHWARMWLDLARYADSSGYPSDQPRKIWAYRDWVIQSLNRNQPFDRFTVEQIAGDLLPQPTDGQLIATAFHRNTMTQNEGGTSDEEFRVAAVVDRVNTTMAVWMGTTIACAQCHTHKYDPITQEEYFQLFAILNQTADADRMDESPLHSFFTAEQSRQRATLERELAQIEQRFAEPLPEALAGLDQWRNSLPVDADWETPVPAKVASGAGARISISGDALIRIPEAVSPTDTTTVSLPLADFDLQAIRIEALHDDRLPGSGPGHAEGNFVVTQIRAEIVPQGGQPVAARRLRVELVSQQHDYLALAEVQVFSGSKNVAPAGHAKQVSTQSENTAADRAIDGNTNGNAAKNNSVAITAGSSELQWWEVEFDADQAIDRLLVWKRMDRGSGSSPPQLRLTLFDARGEPVWKHDIEKPLGRREEVSLSGRRELRFRQVFADATQDGFNAADVLAERPNPAKGWAVGGRTGVDHWLTLIPAEPIRIDQPTELMLTLSQDSKFPQHTLGALRVGVTRAPGMSRLAGIPPAVLTALARERSGPPSNVAEEDDAVRDYYLRQVSPATESDRDRKQALTKELAAIEPQTVPVMAELRGDDGRETRIQRRGNWLDLGEVVGRGAPSVFHSLDESRPADRLALAEWLVSRENPLTARVTVNRFWEAVFGIGIVQTSEDFGTQGELPFHPQLLDWLAVDFMEHGWDVKRLLKQMVMSRAYRQDSRERPELNGRDPRNRLLARGPRFRPTGEVLRDQALFAAGLLSTKVGGPAVRPLAPNLGLTTAFGRSNDWEPSEGEDRHRRSVYTEVRRNAPYASFSTFDAPNREVCTIRRGRTNTPLQAFVTLNDPVFVEAHQALARRIVAETTETGSRIRHAYRICLSRDPHPGELLALEQLYGAAVASFQQAPDRAEKMATQPLGPVPARSDLTELAAWTAVSNVIMNLDEFLMRR